MTDALEYLLAFIIIILVAGFIGLIVAFPVLWLWNWLMPDIFGLTTLTYWQAYGLYFLFTLLFKGGYSSSD